MTKSSLPHRPKVFQTQESAVLQSSLIQDSTTTTHLPFSERLQSVRNSQNQSTHPNKKVKPILLKLGSNRTLRRFLSPTKVFNNLSQPRKNLSDRQLKGTIWLIRFYAHSNYRVNQNSQLTWSKTYCHEWPPIGFLTMINWSHTWGTSLTLLKDILDRQQVMNSAKNYWRRFKSKTHMLWLQHWKINSCLELRIFRLGRNSKNLCKSYKQSTHNSTSLNRISVQKCFSRTWTICVKKYSVLNNN